MFIKAQFIYLKEAFMEMVSKFPVKERQHQLRTLYSFARPNNMIDNMSIKAIAQILIACTICSCCATDSYYRTQFAYYYYYYYYYYCSTALCWD
jgi:hypothetical protein